MAADGGHQEAVLERLMSGYFSEGTPIGDRTALADAAGQAGLDTQAVAAMLEGEGYAADVRGDEREAAELGITAVPFFVIDRRWGLAGAHPPETIRDAIERARSDQAE